MKREYVKEMLEVYAAYADGKTIQWRQESTDPWRDVIGDELDFYQHLEYRVKPIPQYMLVPFDPWTGKIVNGTVNVYDFPPNERTIESFRNRMASGYDVKVIVA
jgi:hypothetical protein